MSNSTRTVNQMSFEHEVDGLARPMTITVEYEAADRSVGISGGWFLIEAKICLPPGRSAGSSFWGPASNTSATFLSRTVLLDRDDFEHVFGATALRVAEEAASDLATADPEQDRAEAMEVIR
jgi:hypothetical protein